MFAYSPQWGPLAPTGSQHPRTIQLGLGNGGSDLTIGRHPLFAGLRSTEELRISRTQISHTSEVLVQSLRAPGATLMATLCPVGGDKVARAGGADAHTDG